jgi:ABC-type polysaccharide/polyol phosphate transport system ATPase subunit
MSQDISITVKELSKLYRLYKRNSDRIKETFHPTRKQYHKPFPALTDVSFSVRQRESVGIIGRNGSGKSTLLQILCGVLQPTSGQIDVNGRISALLELGAGFDPEFTGRENVYLNATIMGLSKGFVENNIEKIFAFADIGEYVDQPVKLYSSGMFVRLAFATAISVNPDILIVDEALAVGDIFFQQKCMQHMKKMMATKTIVLVSHDMHAVSNLCDRVVVMEGGRVIFDGETLDGIAMYTRLVHNEMFGQEKNATVNELEIPERILSRMSVLVNDFNDWIPIKKEITGGAGEVAVHYASIKKGGELFKTIEQGEKVTVRMLISSARNLKEVIFGYTVKDRVGVALFGENSVSLLPEPPSLNEGFSFVTFEFIWPEVSAQEYTLTLGIGEGSHPFDHTIQCWAHNIASFTAITPGKYIHGMFNNRIQLLEMAQVH